MLLAVILAVFVFSESAKAIGLADEDQWKSGVHALSKKDYTYLITYSTLNNQRAISFLESFLPDFLQCNNRAGNFHWKAKSSFTTAFLDSLKELINSDKQQQPEPEDSVYAIPFHCVDHPVLLFVTPADKLQLFQESLRSIASEQTESFAQRYIDHVTGGDLQSIMNAYGVENLANYRLLANKKDSNKDQVFTNSTKDSEVTARPDTKKTNLNTQKTNTVSWYPVTVRILKKTGFTLQKNNWAEQMLLLTSLHSNTGYIGQMMDRDYMLAAGGSLYSCLSHDKNRVYFETCTGRDYQQWHYEKNNFFIPKTLPGHRLTYLDEKGYRITPVKHTINSLTMNNGAVVDDNFKFMMAGHDGSLDTIGRFTYATRLHFISNFYITRYLVDSLSNSTLLYPHNIQDSEKIDQELLRFALLQYYDAGKLLDIPVTDIAHKPAIHNKNGKSFVFDMNYERRQISQDSYTYWQELPFNLLVTDQYAQPLSEIIITVPHRSRSVKDPVPVYAIINLHTDELSVDSPNVKDSGYLERPPRLSVRYWLREGENKIRVPYGGNIAIASYEYSDEALDIKISNAISAPMFTKGDSDATEYTLKQLWQDLAPWSVIEGERVTLIVPSEQLANAGNLTELISVYDLIVDSHEYLWGFDPHSSNGTRRHGHYVFIEDKQIDSGYGHSGAIMPIMPGWHLADQNKMDFWGVAHELGHAYQGIGWHDALGVETSVNTYTLYAQLTLKKESKIEEIRLFEYMIERLKRNEKNLYPDDVNKDRVHYEKLIFLAQIVYSFPKVGWNLFREVNKKEREFFSQNRGYTLYRDQLAIDLFFESASVAVEHNLEEHFNRWSIDVSEAAKNKVRHLPKPDFVVSLSEPAKPDLPQKYRALSQKYAALLDKHLKLKRQDSNLLSTPEAAIYTLPVKADAKIYASEYYYYVLPAMIITTAVLAYKTSFLRWAKQAIPVSCLSR